MTTPAELENDTIVAVATPAGRGGLGVVRLSGPAARRIAAELTGGLDLEPRRAHFAQVAGADGVALDAAVTTYFKAPRSYTGEDVAEISAHGSPVVLAAIVDAALARGARPADPGEFTRRAFLNGRIDLTQAEAVRDLIEAHTLFQARTAARQLHGSVARELRPAKEQLTHVIALLEAGIDFADNDVDTPQAPEVLPRLGQVRSEVRRLLEGFLRHRVVREGLELAILGRPNVGKSSLFNRLLDSDRAIVTAQAGTTRDLVAESVTLDGIPLRLIDTAGIREAENEAEILGIRKSWEAAADAHLTLLVVDGSEAPQVEDLRLLEEIRHRMAGAPKLLLVRNKADLPEAAAEAWRAAAGAMPSDWVISASALTGEGIDRLRAAIRAQALPDLSHDSVAITNARHAHHLQTAEVAIERAIEGIKTNTPHEMLLVDLYETLGQFDAITGQTTVEDILGVIFSTFCIGK